jgi:hypothetical protein
MCMLQHPVAITYVHLLRDQEAGDRAYIMCVSHSRVMQTPLPSSQQVIDFCKSRRSPATTNALHDLHNHPAQQRQREAHIVFVVTNSMRWMLLFANKWMLCVARLIHWVPLQNANLCKYFHATCKCSKMQANKRGLVFCCFCVLLTLSGHILSSGFRNFRVSIVIIYTYAS